MKVLTYTPGGKSEPKEVWIMTEGEAETAKAVLKGVYDGKAFNMGERANPNAFTFERKLFNLIKSLGYRSIKKAGNK
jgi:hypothetical protein